MRSALTDHENSAGPQLLLLTASVIWGFAFVAQRAGMEHIGPFLFNGIRFLLGSLSLVPVLLLRRQRAIPKMQPLPRQAVLLGCAATGIVLFAAASLQQIGIVYTSAGKAGFITGLYVILVPLLGLLRGHHAGKWVWLGSVSAAVGLYFLSIAGALRIELGDALLLGSALGWAIHVYLVGWLASRVRPLIVAIAQFTICGVLSLIIALIHEPMSWEGLWSAGWAILYAGVLSSGVAYTLQVVGQRRIAPAKAGVILSMESVFAVVGGYLLLGESLTARALLGCALMLVGMILSQHPARSRQDRLRS
ncbi:DMT family transporter [Candidatus Bipolaricaulota bacterium]|nr:DMT family transporter [Candidatus Bipolaricaulota bacterium]